MYAKVAIIFDCQTLTECFSRFVQECKLEHTNKDLPVEV